MIRSRYSGVQVLTQPRRCILFQRAGRCELSLDDHWLVPLWSDKNVWLLAG